MTLWFFVAAFHISFSVLMGAGGPPNLTKRERRISAITIFIVMTIIHAIIMASIFYAPDAIMWLVHLVK
jgi:hypothetical protein